MNFKTRFLIVIATNFAVLILMLLLFSSSGLDLSSRLIDLNLNDPGNRIFFIQFLALLLGAFGANFLAGLGKNSLTKKEIEAIADVLGSRETSLVRSRAR